jgi:PPOX class probable F420-dependent enzyme
MAKMTREETEQFLSLPLIAHFITTRADGSPHAVPVWYAFVEGHFYVFAPTRSLKIQNIKRDPRMTISIASQDQPYRYVVANGVAEILTGDITERAVSIASRYEGTEGGMKYIEKLQARFNMTLIAMTPLSVVEWAAG